MENLSLSLTMRFFLIAVVGMMRPVVIKYAAPSPSGRRRH